MTRLRIVLDTNVLVSGMGWPGVPAALVDAAVRGQCQLVTSPMLLEELRRVVAYPKLAERFHDPWPASKPVGSHQRCGGAC